MANDANVIEVDDVSFDKEVLGADVPVLVDFFAQWCGPCKSVAPIVERLASETAGRVKVVKVDIDVSPETARRFSVRGAPTILVFRNGRKTARHLGTTTRERLLELLER